MSAPHLRGCSQAAHTVAALTAVGPAPAGVFPGVYHVVEGWEGRPRTCGGVPSWWAPGIRGPRSAPHLRGCSAAAGRAPPSHAVGPAPAGVFRRVARPGVGAGRRPRTCGGVPPLYDHRGCGATSAPHLRGCSVPHVQPRHAGAVGPAPAGVFPRGDRCPRPPSRRPRTCGGVPRTRRHIESKGWSAPHLRGCSPGHGGSFRAGPVGPAPAGVFRGASRKRTRKSSRPRTCGGVPPGCVFCEVCELSAPHLRGCSTGSPDLPSTSKVGPAPAGVFRRTRSGTAWLRGRPRTCGGVPCSQNSAFAVGTSAPHLRGCSFSGRDIQAAVFVGPAPAGVFPRQRSRLPGTGGRPRTCGGVPRRGGDDGADVVSAPHLRGCSAARGRRRRRCRVGPAPAGVFPAGPPVPARRGCRPRTCGGVPGQVVRIGRGLESAPHLRGCSRPLRHAVLGRVVGPAPAGVFRRPCTTRSSRRSRPRTCGGVPVCGSYVFAGSRSAPHLRGCSDVARLRLAGRLVGPAPAGVFR